jgi:hypothetical protein
MSQVENIKEALQEFCAKEYREAMCGIHNSGEYLVATDGHIMAEISLKIYPVLSEIGENRSEIGIGFPNWKSVIPGPFDRPFETIAISDLKTPDEQFPDPEFVTCPACQGMWSENRKDEYCPECDGKGECEVFTIELIRVNHHYYYNAVYINRLVDLSLALGLNMAELSQGDPLEYPQNFEDRTEADPLMISSTGVRLMAMPVYHDENSDSDHNIINKVVTRSPKPVGT